MKRIILDVDDVITGGELLNSINNFLNTSYVEEDVKGYYIQDLLGDKKEEYFNQFENVDLYGNAKLYDDCYEVLNKIKDKYEIYICSAFIYPEVKDKCSNNLKYKYDFLYRELPFIDPNNYMFASNKLIINGDIRIDDKISNLGNAEINLLYTAYHNKNITKDELKLKNIIRVDNWKDIEKILLNN